MAGFVFLLLPVVAPVLHWLHRNLARKDAQSWPMGHAVGGGGSLNFMSTMPCMLSHSEQECVI